MNQKRKIITDRPTITDKEILSQKQSFQTILKKYYSGSAAGGSGFSSLLGWGIGGLSVLAIIAVVYFTQFHNDTASTPLLSAIEKDSTQVVQHDSSIVTETNSRCINPPYAELVEYEEYPISQNNRKRTITTKSGSIITIPAHAFVNENGEPVTKNITIRYRDFHNPMEFFLSGIPMDYDSAGVNYTFTSAGMFDIDAKAGGEQLYLKEDKEIELQLVSKQDEVYNFYNYDTSENQWNYLYTEEESSIKPFVNKSVEKKEQVVETKTVETQEKEYTFSDLHKLDPNKRIELLTSKQTIKVRKPTNYFFNAEDVISNKSSLNKIDNLVLEIDKGQGFKESYYTVAWDTVFITEQNYSYTLIMIKGGKKLNYSVTPILDEKSYATAMEEFKTQEAASEKEIAYARKRQKETLDIAVINEQWTSMRNIKVNNLGTYNCDRPLPMPLFAKNGSRFIYDSNGNRLFYTQLFVSQPKKNVLWAYPMKRQWYYSEQLDNVGWFITQQGQIAIIEPSIFNQENHERFTAMVYEKDEGLKKLFTYLN